MLFLSPQLFKPVEADLLNTTLLCSFPFRQMSTMGRDGFRTLFHFFSQLSALCKLSTVIVTRDFFELFLRYWTVLNNLNDDSVVHVSSKGLTPITFRSNGWYPQKSTRRCSERCQRALCFHRITGELRQPFWDKLG